MLQALLSLLNSLKAQDPSPVAPFEAMIAAVAAATTMTAVVGQEDMMTAEAAVMMTVAAPLLVGGEMTVAGTTGTRGPHAAVVVAAVAAVAAATTVLRLRADLMNARHHPAVKIMTLLRLAAIRATSTATETDPCIMLSLL